MRVKWLSDKEGRFEGTLIEFYFSDGEAAVRVQWDQYTSPTSHLLRNIVLIDSQNGKAAAGVPQDIPE